MRRVLLYNTTPQYVLSASGTTQHAATGGTLTITSIPAGITLIVVAVAGGSSSPSVSDGTNTYSNTTAYGSGQFTRQHYVFNPSTSSSMTWTFTNTNYSAWVGLFTGSTIPTPAFDQQNGNNSVNQTSIASNSITTTLNGDLIVASACTITGSADTPGAVTGYTLVHLPFVSGQFQGLVVYYKTQQYIQSENVTFAGTSMRYTGAMIASYKN